MGKRAKRYFKRIVIFTLWLGKSVVFVVKKSAKSIGRIKSIRQVGQIGIKPISLAFSKVKFSGREAAKLLQEIKQNRQANRDKLKNNLDHQLILIQKSANTNIKSLGPTHNKLRSKYHWYYVWHLNPHSSKINLSALALFLISFALGITYVTLGNQIKTFAGVNPGPKITTVTAIVDPAANVPGAKEKARTKINKDAAISTEADKLAINLGSKTNNDASESVAIQNNQGDVRTLSFNMLVPKTELSLRATNGSVAISGSAKIASQSLAMTIPKALAADSQPATDNPTPKSPDEIKADKTTTDSVTVSQNDPVGRSYAFDVSPNIQTSYKISNNQVKEYIVLKTPDALGGISSVDFNLSSISDLTVLSNRDGSYVFSDLQTKEQLFKILPPTLADKNGQHADNKIKLTIDQANNLASYQINPDYLKSAITDDLFPLTIDPTIVTVISGTTVTQPLSYSFERSVFETTDGVQAIIYQNGSGLKLKSSADKGVTWTDQNGGNAIGGDASTSANGYSGYLDPTTNSLYFTYVTGTSVMFNYLTYSAGTFTLQTERTIESAGTSQGFPSITADSTQNLYLAYRYYDGANYYIYEKSSTDAANAYTTWSASTAISTASASADIYPIVLIQNNTPAIIYSFNAASIRWSYYNAAAWVAEATITSEVDADTGKDLSAAVDTSNNLHLTWRGSGTSGIFYRKNTYTNATTRTWDGSSTAITTDHNDINPSIGVATSTGYIYIYYADYGANANEYNIVYKRFVAAWDSSPTSITTTATDDNIQTSTAAWSQKLAYTPVAFRQGSASPFNVQTSAPKKFYWIATTSQNWSSTTSWSDTSGGSTNNAVPGEFDEAVFDNQKAGNVTLAAATTVGAITNTNYAGTFSTSSSNYSLTVQGNFTWTSGTLKIDNTSNITIYGDFTNNGGTLTSGPGAGTAGATIYFKGNSTTFTPNTSTYNDIEISKNPGATLTLGGNLLAVNSYSTFLRVNTGTLDVSSSNYSITIGGIGYFSTSGSNFNARSGTVYFTGSWGYIISPTATNYYNLTLQFPANNGNSAIGIYTGSTINVTNSLNMVRGGFNNSDTTGGGTINLSGDLNSSGCGSTSSDFRGKALINWTQAGDRSWTPGSCNLPSLKFNSNRVVTLGSALNVTSLEVASGTLDVSANNYSVNLLGSDYGSNLITSAATFNPRQASITLTSWGTWNPGAETYYNVTIDAGGIWRRMNSASVTISHMLTLYGGQIISDYGQTTWSVANVTTSAGGRAGDLIIDCTLNVSGDFVLNRDFKGDNWHSLSSIVNVAGTFTQNVALTGTANLSGPYVLGNSAAGGTGTINWTQAGDTTWTPGTGLPPNLKFNSARTVTLGSALYTVAGIEIAQGILDASANNYAISVGNINSSTGYFKLTGAGAFNPRNGLLAIGWVNYGTFSWIPGTEQYYNVTVVAGGGGGSGLTLDNALHAVTITHTFLVGNSKIASGATYNVTGDLSTANGTIYGAVINATINVSGDYISGAISGDGSGIVNWTQGGDRVWTPSGGGAPHIKFNSNRKITLGASLYCVGIEVAQGTLDNSVGNYTITVEDRYGYGSEGYFKVISPGIFIPGNSNLDLYVTQGNSFIWAAGSETYYNVTITGTGCVANLMVTNLTAISHSLNYNGGFLKSGSINLGGNLSIGASAFNGTTTVNLVGGNAQSISNSGTAMLPIVSVAKTAGTTATITSSWDFGSALTVTSGTLALNTTGAVNFQNTITMNGGTIDMGVNTGAVTLQNTVTINSGATMTLGYNHTVTGTINKVATINSGGTLTGAGTLAQGLTLNSSSGTCTNTQASCFNIDAKSGSTISFAFATISNDRAVTEAGVTPLTDRVGTDGGGNYNWTFTRKPNAPSSITFTQLDGNGKTSQLPVITFVVVDPDGSDIQSKVEFATDSGMSQNLLTFDQSSGQAGYSNQNAHSNTGYTSGSTETFSLPQANILTQNATYYYRISAVDTWDTNYWGNSVSNPFAVAPLSQTAWTSTTYTIQAGVCQIISYQTKNTLSEVAKVTGNTTFDLTKVPSTAHFYNSDQCGGGNIITQSAINTGASSATVYYKDTVTSSGQAITAVENPSQSWTRNASNITITPAATGSLALNGQPASTVAGAVFANPISVTIYDTFSNVKTDFTGPVYFASSDTQAIIPYTNSSPYTFTSGGGGDNGVHQFPGAGFILKTSGGDSPNSADFTLEAHSGSNTDAKTITVTPGPFYDFHATTTTYPATSAGRFAMASWQWSIAGYSGTPYNPQIKPYDNYGNIIYSYSGKVWFDILKYSDSVNNSTADYAITNYFDSDTGYTYTSGGVGGEDNGTHSFPTGDNFNITVNTSGTLKMVLLTSTTGGHTTFANGSYTAFDITIKPQKIEHFGVTTTPTLSRNAVNWEKAVDTTFTESVTLTAYDVFGNVKTDYGYDAATGAGMAYFYSSDPQATLPYSKTTPADSTSCFHFPADANGTYTFTPQNTQANYFKFGSGGYQTLSASECVDSASTYYTSNEETANKYDTRLEPYNPSKNDASRGTLPLTSATPSKIYVATHVPGSNHTSTVHSNNANDLIEAAPGYQQVTLTWSNPFDIPVDLTLKPQAKIYRCNAGPFANPTTDCGSYPTNYTTLVDYNATTPTIPITPSTRTDYIDTGLTNGNNYYYKIAYLYKKQLSSCGDPNTCYSESDLSNVVNAVPADIAPRDVSASQLDRTDATNPGKVSISYKLRWDSVVSLAYYNPTTNTWHNATSPAMSGDVGSSISGDENLITHTAYFDPKIDFDGQYLSSSFKMRVKVNTQGSNAYNDSGLVTLDSMNPTVVTIISDASAGTSSNFALNVTDNPTSLPMQMMVSTDQNFVGASWETYAATVTGLALNSHSTIYFKFRDLYSNQTIQAHILYSTPPNFAIKDASYINSGKYRLVLIWDDVVPTPKLYHILRSTDGVDYAQVDMTTKNGFIDINLDSTITYAYKVQAEDTIGNLSISAGPLSSKPGAAPDVTAAPRVTLYGWKQDQGVRAQIAWDTDQQSDSSIAYSTSPLHAGDDMTADNDAVVKIAGNPELTLNHEIWLYNLEPAQKYYFKVISKNEIQIAGYSAVLDFTTPERIPLLVSGTLITDITQTTANVSWTTSKLSTTVLEYGSTSSYGTTLTDPTWNTEHKFKLENLTDGADYHLRISATDSDGNVTVSDDYVFSTPATPVISNFKTETIGSNTATLTWTTNVNCDSNVQFTSNSPVPTVQTEGRVAGVTVPMAVQIGQQGKPDSTTVHSVTLIGLADKVSYTATASSTDKFGNVAKSAPLTFSTVIDAVPPKINNLKSEITSSGSGTAVKYQAIISWETDKSSTSQAEYGQGVSGGYDQSTKEDLSLNQTHFIVLSDLNPNSAFHVRVKSTSRAGVSTYSDDFSLITPPKQKQLFQMIMDAIASSFSWVPKFMQKINGGK